MGEDQAKTHAAECKQIIADDGAILKYHVCSPGKTPSPTIITHGFGSVGGVEAAERFVSLASAGIRVIGISYRSMGENPVGKAVPMTVERAARDLHAVLMSVQAESEGGRVSLFGNSMGANVIWRLADIFGEEHIDRYVFVDQPVCVAKSFQGRPPIPGLIDTLRSSDSEDSHEMANLIEDSEATDNTERIPRCIHRPCLVYGGEASFVPDSSENAKWIAMHVGGPARVLIYPQPYGTHSPQKEAAHNCADKFCRDLISYLSIREEDLYAEEQLAEHSSL